MSKINIQSIASLTNEQSALTALANNESEIETKSDTFLSRDGTSPNQMTANLDMNSQRIINLPEPVGDTEPVRLIDMDTFAGGIVGPAGPPGAPGAPGSNGTNGADGLNADVVTWKYTWATSTSGDPGTGKIAVNNVAPGSATGLQISETDANGNALAAEIARWGAGATSAGRARIKIAKNATNFLLLTLTSDKTDAGLYDTFTASGALLTGTLSLNDTVYVSVSVAGVDGTNGAGGDVFSVETSSVDGQLTLFSGTLGKTIKKSTASGILKQTTNTVTAATAGTDYYAPGSTDVAVADGGTGASTLTSNGVLIGHGTSAVTGATAMTDGQLLVGQTSAAPTPQTVGTDLTLSNTGVATIQPGVVTLAKMANIATDRLIGRDTAATGVPEAITVGGGLEFTGTAGIQRSALTGDITATAGSNTTAIATDAVVTAKILNSNVTYAKIQNVSATDKLLGRSTAGAGVVEEIPLTASGRTVISQTSIANVRSSLGLDTADSPTFAAVTIGTVPVFTNIPQNSKSAAYELVLSDAQKHILHPSADTTARIFTIPANSGGGTPVAFPIGTAVTFVNQNAGGVITIKITTDTMRLAGAGTTGDRTLAANGIATALKITATEWIISGTGLT